MHETAANRDQTIRRANENDRRSFSRRQRAPHEKRPLRCQSVKLFRRNRLSSSFGAGKPSYAANKLQYAAGKRWFGSSKRRPALVG
ncbi:hypothetical protein [Alloprevotella tannerae]|uniref:hypothetical protein n=1 Tax=Alloprevotella tannerae TaxID=76122 RepID=UPI0028E6F5BB|nr:hypothetical protein [Alloprevotella tannerae]